MIDIGKIFRVRNWDHCMPNATLKYCLGRQRKNLVALMVCLGEEPLDGSTPIDIDEVMLRLGWRRAKHQRER